MTATSSLRRKRRKQLKKERGTGRKKKKMRKKERIKRDAKTNLEERESKKKGKKGKRHTDEGEKDGDLGVRKKFPERKHQKEKSQGKRENEFISEAFHFA